LIQYGWPELTDYVVDLLDPKIIYWRGSKI